MVSSGFHEGEANGVLKTMLTCFYLASKVYNPKDLEKIGICPFRAKKSSILPHFSN